MPCPFLALPLPLQVATYGHLGCSEKLAARASDRIKNELGGREKNWFASKYVYDAIVSVKRDEVRVVCRTRCGEAEIKCSHRTPWRRRMYYRRNFLDEVNSGIFPRSIGLYVMPGDRDCELSIPIQELDILRNPYSILLDMCPEVAQFQLKWLKRRGFSSEALAAVPSRRCLDGGHSLIAELLALFEVMKSAPTLLLQLTGHRINDTLAVIGLLAELMQQNSPPENHPRAVLVTFGIVLRKEADSELLKRDIKELRAFLKRHIPKSSPTLAVRLSLNTNPPQSIKAPKRIPGLNYTEVDMIASGFGSQITASSDNTTQEYYIARKRIVIPNRGEICWIAAGRAHSLVATSSTVYAFGHNVHGQCGLDPDLMETVVTLLSFGLNEDGQCANGQYGIQPEPLRLQGDAAQEKLVDIRGTTDTLVAISDKGELFIWGQNEHGQAGPNLDLQLAASRHLPMAKRIVSADATCCSCVALDEDGAVYTWGTQFLGLGPKVTKLGQPTLLDQPLFGNEKVKRVFAGNTCVGALTETGNFYIWGQNRFGQLALDTDKDQLFPLQVYLPRDVVQVALGTDHTLFITK
ncbi:unnamed protein product, partial [Mesorhabditis spiculigera]